VVDDVATAVFDDCEPWERKLYVSKNKITWSNDTPKAVRGNDDAIAA